METLRIVVVDDEPGICSGVRGVLSGCRFQFDDFYDDVGFEIQSADSLSESMRIMENEEPDIAIIDYKLPDGHGISLMKGMAEKGMNTLVIMITAYASLDVAINATKSGAFDFISKPFTPEELKAAIKKAAKHLFLQRKARRLEAERRSMRFQFVSVLSHELKSPINAVDGYLSILKDRPHLVGSERFKDVVERCQFRIDQMRKLILDLLDLTRIESGERKRKVEVVQLGKIAQDTIDMLKGEANKSNVLVTLEAEGSTEILADPEEITIILNNLICNAIKYNKKGGDVHVRMKGDESRVVVDVHDTGIGMAAEETARIFGDFVRIKNEFTENISGSGLGLSTARKIAQLYDGNIRVVSKVGAGSTFTVELRKDHGKKTEK